MLPLLSAKSRLVGNRRVWCLFCTTTNVTRGRYPDCKDAQALNKKNRYHVEWRNIKLNIIYHLNQGLALSLSLSRAQEGGEQYTKATAKKWIPNHNVGESRNHSTPNIHVFGKNLASNIAFFLKIIEKSSTNTFRIASISSSRTWENWPSLTPSLQIKPGSNIVLIKAADILMVAHYIAHEPYLKKIILSGRCPVDRLKAISSSLQAKQNH